MFRRLALGSSLVLVAGVIAVGFFTRETWLSWVMPAASTDKGDAPHDSNAGEVQQVKLSPQAQANLRLVVKPLTVSTYWRTIQVPGQIVDRPAQSDRSIVATVNGVVTQVPYFPGDTVKAGDTLFTLTLHSETLHLTQSDLFKTIREIEMTKEQQKRFYGIAEKGKAMPEAKLTEVENQLSRLTVARRSISQGAADKGLTPEQI